MRTESARIRHARAALMIEELYGKTGVECRLIRIRDWARDLVQAESSKQLCFVRDAMVNANGKLIGDG